MNLVHETVNLRALLLWLLMARHLLDEKALHHALLMFDLLLLFKSLELLLSQLLLPLLLLSIDDVLDQTWDGGVWSE